MGRRAQLETRIHSVGWGPQLENKARRGTHIWEKVEKHNCRVCPCVLYDMVMTDYT